MHMIMSPENKIRSPISQFKSHFTYLISRSMAAFMLFVFILWCLRVEYFSGFSISYFTFNPGRTHMFLVCNGIVFILVKSSVLATPDEDDDGTDQNVMKKKMNVEIVQMDCEVSEEKHVKTEEIAVRNEEEEEEEEEEEDQEEDLKTSNGYVLIPETEQVDEQSVDEEEQEEVQGIEEEKEEDEFEELSVDELNKKFDEFIRRMRSVISNGNGFF